MNPQARREGDGKHKKKMQDNEDPEQSLEHRHQILTAARQDSTKSNSVLPPAVASCSDQTHDEIASAPGGASGASSREKTTVEAAQGGGVLPSRRYWWGDCQPQVVLLREALLSSAPDIAVLGPLHGCFSFYMTHLHNEVLSSTYARTMTLGANVTRLESAFMWIGGWRPTSALVLIYSLMGIDIENALQAVRVGREAGETCTSSLLSPRQLAVMHSLQKHTQNAEMRITKKLTLLQMLIGDQDVLEAVLLDAASPVANDSSRFHQVAERRMSRFRRLLLQAEELRLHTLKDLLSLLTPIQAARCGVAVFEMCSALRIMGSTTLPTLPVPTRVLPVALPTSPTPSALVGKTLVAGPREPVVPDFSTSDGLLNPYDVPHRQSNEPLVSDISPHDSILTSFDITPRHSDEPLVSGASPSSNTQIVSDALLGQSDETQILVPSGSDNSSLQLPFKDSFRSFDRKGSSRSLPVTLPPVHLNLDDTLGLDPARDEQPPRVGKFSEGIITNRLLLLSPASSDVTIQSCSLESSELGASFEMRPQLPLLSAGVDDYYGERSGLSDSGDMGVVITLDNQLAGQSPRRMAVSWFWSSVRYLKCSLHQKYAEWAHDRMHILWRKKTLEIT